MWAAYGANKCSIGEWAPFNIDHPTFFMRRDPAQTLSALIFKCDEYAAQVNLD